MSLYHNFTIHSSTGVYESRILYANNIGGDDYTSGPYSVTFPAGVTRVPFDVPINDDRVLEIKEKFNLVINHTSLPKNVTRGNIVRTTVIIRDNDGKDVLLYLCTTHVTELYILWGPIFITKLFSFSVLFVGRHFGAFQSINVHCWRG